MFAIFCLVVSFEKEAFSRAGTNQPKKKVEEPKKEHPALGIDGPQLVYQGKSITYTIAMINITNEILKDVILRAEIPSGFSMALLKKAYLVLANLVRLISSGMLETSNQVKQKHIRLNHWQNLKALFIITAEGSTSSTRDFPVKASITTNIIVLPVMHISTYDTEDPYK